MNLARMQDVGGCRAELPSVDDVRRVARSYEDRPSRRHVVHIDDYLSNPRASGYRGIHLASRFEPGEEEEAGLRRDADRDPAPLPPATCLGRRRNRGDVVRPSAQVQRGRRRLAALFRLDGLGNRIQRGMSPRPRTTETSAGVSSPAPPALSTRSHDPNDTAGR